MQYTDVLNDLVKSQLPLRLKRLRDQHGLTQGQLAQRAKLAPSTISQIENGSFSGLRFETLVRLAGIFEVSLDYMVALDNAPIVRAIALAGRPCPECGKVETHSLAECILEMYDRGRTMGFIGARFGFTLASVGLIIQEESRASRKRP